MPGEADRLKKENEELNELLQQSLVDNQRLLDTERANLNTNLMLQKQVEELEEENAKRREECERLGLENASLEGSLELANEKLAEAEEQVRLLGSYNTNLEWTLREANEKLGKAQVPKEKVTVVGPFWEEEGLFGEPEEPIWVPAMRAYRDALAEEILAKQPSLPTVDAICGNGPLPEGAQVVSPEIPGLTLHELLALRNRVEWLEENTGVKWNAHHTLRQRVDSVEKSIPALYARLDASEVAQRDLFSRMARLERTEEPLPERRWWWK